METPMPLNLEATVEHRFHELQRCGHGDARQLHGGSLEPGLLTAAEGTVVTDLTNIIATDDASSVTISGDFSFAEMAWLDTAATCNVVASPGDLLQMGRRNGDG